MSDLRPRHVRVRPGNGRLCRTADAVLFTPEVGAGWEELVAALQADEAAGRGVEPVATTLAARGLEAPPLVLVTWRPRLAVLAFGDVELRSDHPSLPLLTGRGSQTWVEHSVPDLGEPLRFDVGGPDAEDDTDLVAGVVPAQGFTLELARATPHPTPAPAAVSEAGPGPAPGSEPASPVASEPPPTQAPPPPSPPPLPATDGALAAGDPPEPFAWQPPPRTTDDPDDALRAIQAAAVTEEVEAAAFDPPSPGAAPRSQDVAPPDPEAGSSQPLVDAVICPTGHPNPPGRGTCGSCDALLAPDTPVRAVPRPPLGALHFDDGAVVTVEADLVLGRRPPDDGRQVYALAGDRVSRHHAELQLRGWEVLLHDPGSRNGTYVVGPGSAEPVRVDTGVPVRLEPGARVYLGTRSFHFERTASSPAGSDDPAAPGS